MTMFVLLLLTLSLTTAGLVLVGATRRHRREYADLRRANGHPAHEDRRIAA